MTIFKPPHIIYTSVESLKFYHGLIEDFFKSTDNLFYGNKLE